MLQAGARLGNYQLLQRLGGGAFSEVWKAMRVPGSDCVALKIADRDEIRADSAARKGLDHPSIVRLVEASPDSDPPFLAMEFVEAPSLRSRLEAGPLPFEEAVSIARSILSGLAHAHGRGVAHLDLKPENILLGTPPKITDFGSGRAASSADLSLSIDTSEEKNKRIVGTLSYMAPELPAGRAGPAADLYSFGIILYEMLTGHLPVGAFRYPSDLFPEIPSAVDDLLRRCLWPDPAQRFAHAKEAEEALNLAVDRMPLAPPLSVQAVYEVRNVRDLVDHALSSADRWADIRHLLASGELARWLRSVRRFDMARIAEEPAGGDLDAQLERVLESSGHFHAPVLELDMGAEIDLGLVPRGETRALRIRAIKHGRGYLKVAVRSGSSLIRPAVDELKFTHVDREESEIDLDLSFSPGGSRPYDERRETLDIGPRRVSIRYTVDLCDAELHVDPNPLTIVRALGQKATAELRVTNKGDRPADVGVQPSVPWLEVTSVGTLAPGESCAVRVEVLHRLAPRIEGPRADAAIEFAAGSRKLVVPVSVTGLRRLDLALLVIGFFVGLLPYVGELFMVLVIAALLLGLPTRKEPVGALRRSNFLCDQLSLLAGIIPGVLLHLLLFLP
jgi:hypothetical protein